MEAKKAIPSLLKLFAKALELYIPERKAIRVLEKSAERMAGGGSTPSLEVVEKEMSRVDPEKARSYTAKRAREHIIAVEDHLLSSDEDLCKACLEEKHLPALRMYVREGQDFCVDQVECEAYEKLGKIVDKVEEAMFSDFSKEVRKELRDEFRRIRKKISGYERTARTIKKELNI